MVSLGFNWFWVIFRHSVIQDLRGFPPFHRSIIPSFPRFCLSVILSFLRLGFRGIFRRPGDSAIPPSRRPVIPIFRVVLRVRSVHSLCPQPSFIQVNCEITLICRGFQNRMCQAGWLLIAHPFFQYHFEAMVTNKGFSERTFVFKLPHCSCISLEREKRPNWRENQENGDYTAAPRN